MLMITVMDAIDDDTGSEKLNNLAMSKLIVNGSTMLQTQACCH